MKKSVKTVRSEPIRVTKVFDDEDPAIYFHKFIVRLYGSLWTPSEVSR